MHTPGASVAKIMHPAVCLYDLPYIKVLICKEKHEHPGCIGAQICPPGSQNVHTGCRVHP